MWADYNPKQAMPKQYGNLSTDGVVIPTTDAVAWKAYPSYAWIYNKLKLAQSQEHSIACDLVGVVPKAYPVVLKPVYNLLGGGIGARVCHSYAEYINNIHLQGYFWSDFEFGEHYSIDYILLNGKIKHTIVFRGEKLQFGLFDYWELTSVDTSYFDRWVEKHLKGYTGCLNIETINKTIIEAHLRMGDIDRLGDASLMQAIYCLYNAGIWEYYNNIPSQFYIAALFGNTTTTYNINLLLARECFKHLTYFQFDQQSEEYMGAPIRGKRLALFCDQSLERVCDARNIAIALITPDLDGIYTDALIGFKNLCL